MTDQPTQPARYVRLPGGYVHAGQLAGTSARHPYAPDAGTGSTCLACWGYADDYRHLGGPTLPTVGIGALPDGRRIGVRRAWSRA